MAEQLVHVAVGVITQADKKILISLRHASAHQGGLWEFPGGKVEAGESVQQALQRELNEELGITVVVGKSIIEVRHEYPDKTVLLDVWHIASFTGEAIGREGQQLRWIDVKELADYAFPQANYPIIEALISEPC
jgi:8-oxo-dGTP diphosphatase